MHGGERLVTQSARELLAEAKKLRWERRFDDAIELLEKALQVAEQAEE